MTREQLVVLAERAGARSAVLEALQGLPAGRFRDLRQLWPALPDIPIEAGPTDH